MADAGGVVAAVFEPPQRLDHLPRYRVAPDDADDAAHFTLSRTLGVYGTLGAISCAHVLGKWGA